MGLFLILNLFLVVTVLSLSCFPAEVGGYNSLDYPTREFYYHPWRRYNPRKRMETDVANNTVVVDGQVLAGYNKIIPTAPIYYKYKLEVEGDEASFKNSRRESSYKKTSVNKERKNENVQTVYGMKILFGRLPVTILF